MNYLFLLTFLVFSYQGFSQILPSSHGVHHKKSSGGAVSDTWDSSTKASCITLSNSNLTSLESNCSGFYWYQVYGSTGVSSGIKEWELTIDAWDNTNNTLEVMIGVAKLRTQNPNASAGIDSYCYILENGDRWTRVSGSVSTNNYGASYGVGDVIKISLNIDTNQLTFYKNGVSQGVAFNVSNGTYYLVASIVANTNTQITITG